MRNEDATEAAPTAGVGPPEVPIGHPEGRRVDKPRGRGGGIGLRRLATSAQPSAQ